MNELRSLYEQFWSGLSWVHTDPDNPLAWEQQRNDWGFTDTRTGRLIQAFSEGTVPPGFFSQPGNSQGIFIQYPELTPSLLQSSLTSVSVVSRNVQNIASANNLVIGVLGQIHDAIPEEGLFLKLENSRGYVAMFRGNPFSPGTIAREGSGEMQGIVNLIYRGYIS